MDLEQEELKMITYSSIDCPLREGIIGIIRREDRTEEYCCTRWSNSNSENPVYTYKDCPVLFERGFCEHERRR